MAEKQQFEILLRVLKRFQEAGVLKDLMLIGSWCLQFYRYHFENPDKLPAFRTLDVDFLIPHASKIKTDVNIPEILRREGFVPSFNRSNDIVKYDHRELRVEFLVPELGKGGRSKEIKTLHVKAVALRYLNLLLDYPLLVQYEGLEVRVPEPAVFALHKLIVSSRRAKAEKRSKDLEAAVGILEFLWDKPREVEKIKSILSKIPQSWRKLIASTAGRHYPPVSEIIKSL